MQDSWVCHCLTDIWLIRIEFVWKMIIYIYIHGKMGTYTSHMDSTATTNQNPVDVRGVTYHGHIMFAQLFKVHFY